VFSNLGEVADKLLSNPSSVGRCYSQAGGLVSESHPVRPQQFPSSTSTSSGKARHRTSKKSKPKSPYPFSVDAGPSQVSLDRAGGWDCGFCPTSASADVQYVSLWWVN
jgi:hypothetical protein